MSSEPTALKPIPDRLVVLTFDDGCESDIENVAPLLTEHGFGATFFVNEAQKPTNGWRAEHYLTWDDVAELHAAGFEIGNHTRNHPDVAGLSKAEFVEELEYIERRCEEHGVPRPTTFCYPGFHWSRGAIEVLAEKGFVFARAGAPPGFAAKLEIKGMGARGPVYDPVVDHPLLVPTTGCSGPDWGFDDLVWAVDQARGGKITVLCFHGVPDLDHPWVHTDPAAFVKYMATLDDAGCTVIAMRDLIRYVNPAEPRPIPSSPSKED